MFTYKEPKEVEEVKNPPTETPTPETVEVKTVEQPIQKPIKSANNGNTASFFNNISQPRQAVPEPPKPQEAEPEKTEETTVEEPQKEKLSQKGVGIGSDFIVTTEDLIIPEFMAYFDPDDEAEAEDYELDDKKKEYLKQAWDKYLSEKSINMTPGQELIYAHIVGFGAPALLMGAHKLLKYLKESKEEKKASKVLKESIALQKELNELKAKAPQQQRATTTQQEPQAQQTEVVPQKTPGQTVGIEEQPLNGTLKTCANTPCRNTFKPGEGFAKKKTSKFYDLCCSTRCTNRVIGLTGGAKNKTK